MRKIGKEVEVFGKRKLCQIHFKSSNPKDKKLSSKSQTF